MKVTPRLFLLSRDNKLALGVTILSGFLAGLFTIAQAAGLSRVVDGVFLGGWQLTEAVGLLRLMLLIVFARGCLAWVSEVSATAAALHIKSDLRRQLFGKILRLGPGYTRGERSGELVNAAIEGVEQLDAYFSQYLPQLFIAALVPLSILLIVLPRDPISGLVLLLTAPLIPVFMILIGKTAETLTKRQWDTLGLLSAHFLDSLQGLTTLKELGRSREWTSSIAESSNRFRDRTLSVLRVTFLSALVLEMVSTVSTAVVAVEVGLRLLYGQLPFQQAFFLLILAPEFYLPMRMLGWRFHAGMSGATAARRIFEVLDAPEEREDGSRTTDQGYQPNSSSKPGTIGMEHLSYKYPGESIPALQDINLKILAGEHVALVGTSGSGKSTLAALLLGFIHPDHGQIMVDKRSMAEIPSESWLRSIAWVPQQPTIFHDSIEANLRLAKPDASDEEIQAALRAAHLDEFVGALPERGGTVVGEEGKRLSSGQAQRLALARAFLKNAPVLILDEPTSSLDPEQEMLIESALRDVMRGRTVITIAHRLNTVRNADRIFVLEQGCLVEEGTHSQLLANGGVYTKFVGVNPRAGEAGPPKVDQVQVVETIIPELKEATVKESHRSGRIPVLIRLLGFLNGSWQWVTLSVVLGALTVGSNVGLLGTSAFLISSAALHPGLGSLQIAITGVRFFGITRGVFRYAERLVSHDATFRLISRLRTWFFQALEPLAPARLMELHAGDLLSRIVADVGTLENFYVRAIAPPLVAVVVAVGMWIFFSHFSVHLAMINLVFMLSLGVGLPFLMWTLTRRPAANLVSQRATQQTHFLDSIQGLADIIVFGRGADYAELLARDDNACIRSRRRLGSLTGFSNGLTTLLVNLGMLAVLATAIPLVVLGNLPGTMLAVLCLTALAGFEAVIPLAPAAQSLSLSNQAARRLFEVVDTVPVVRDPPGVMTEITPAAHPSNLDLRVSELTFNYPDQVAPALKGISFHLAPGKRIAIVGPSGAGKSTLVRLLLRFWDYSKGQITLGEHEYHEYCQEELRRRFSVISQQTYFFNDTIRNNLLLACPGAGDADIKKAAQAAQIDEFITGLPRDYETLIGERGFRLSSGERQRLAAARAILKNAPIFLLDEPTANLDAITERHLLDELYRLTIGKSLLLITHRLVALENMDEILVLEHGRVVERGSHSDLLILEGLYRKLWDLQNRFLPDGEAA